MIVPTAHLFELLRGYFHRYGYWTVAGALLLENAGVPVPGETTLLYASFLAYSEHRLRLPLIIAVGIVCAVLGDNAGFAARRFGGRRLVDRYLHLLHVSRETVRKGERYFERRGPVTILFARFVAGLRIVAGPLAGTLRMPWRRFVIFNFLGAAAWVTSIATIGYLFGSQLDRLLPMMGRADFAIAGVVVAAAALWWWWKRRPPRAPRDKSNDTRRAA